ncbi:glucose-1-phosphate cytidylyltransferase [Ruegeria sediminis]|uniref:Glucose-1-phosphate cytidylyltransferase n=1 Tax=Ruegeria sediminis TaxID=2583820 RepID=A0ABY2WW99_9RHOB|nr:glucose-1-phosphate cytidylyltransferase [Ruegeria sediminis]TMV07030.1 glucose-1-phosphate cytidylyltransferase [Ruegeria sediminis]
MKCVILAGGLGTRLSEETVRIPKPMVEIGGRPIIWHIMKIYAAHGITDFIVCLGYKGYVIKEYFANYFLHSSDFTIDLANGDLEIANSKSEPWRVTLVNTGEGSETGGRLGRIMHLLKDEEAFCMTYGDGVGDIDVTALIKFHRNHGKQATLTAVVPPGRFGALELSSDRIARFAEKPSGDGGFINGGFFVLHPSVGELIQGDDTIWERAPLETLAAQGELMAFRHSGFWQPMDTLRDRRQLEARWLEGNAPWKVWE